MRVNIRIVEGKKRSKLNESVPSEIELTGWLRRKLVDAGVDLENAPSDWVQITSNRDPRIKSGVNVFIFPSPGRSQQIFTLNGEILLDTTFRELGSGSWKNIINSAEKIWHLDITPESVDALRAKRADRLAAKKGSVDRYNPDDTSLSLRKRRRLDKSGYPLPDPNKYKDMLAEYKLTKYQEVLNGAKETFIKLASAISEVPQSYANQYGNLMRHISDEYKHLEDFYSRYTSYKGDPEKFDGSYERGMVLYTIRELDDYVKEGKKLLSEINV